MTPTAFYSDEHRCWFVPVAAEMVTSDELVNGVEPVRLQLSDGQLWITRLEAPGEGAASKGGSP